MVAISNPGPQTGADSLVCGDGLNEGESFCCSLCVCDKIITITDTSKLCIMHIYFYVLYYNNTEYQLLCFNHDMLFSNLHQGKYFIVFSTRTQLYG